ncbi:MAG: DUF1292 domain-containing protein [Bacillota bacterium]
MNDQNFVIKGEDGTEYNMELYGCFKIEGKRYAVLIEEQHEREEAREEPSTEMENAFLFRIEQDEQGKDVLVAIEDEAEFNRVAEEIEALEEEEDLP